MGHFVIIQCHTRTKACDRLIRLKPFLQDFNHRDSLILELIISLSLEIYVLKSLIDEKFKEF